MMRKLSLPLVLFGLLVIAFAVILPVNQYGIEGSVDCDGPLKTLIFICLGLVFTLIGVLIFFLKPFWDWKSNKFFYSVIFIIVISIAIKIPEIYRESQFNEENCQ